MLWTVDRIEDAYAVLISENPQLTFSVPLMALGGVREGDVLEISVDALETERRKTKNRDLLRSLFVDTSVTKNP